MPHTYEIDREKYGLPCGPDDPMYTADKWPLSKAMAHLKEAGKALGPQIADLFAASADADAESRLARIASGGYLSAVLEAATDFDFLASFKRMAHDAKLKRTGREGVAMVYQDTATGHALATDDLVNGLEHYYAGQSHVVYLLWWAMLCENTAPFAALHGWIAGVLQRRKPAPSPLP